MYVWRSVGVGPVGAHLSPIATREAEPRASEPVCGGRGMGYPMAEGWATLLRAVSVGVALAMVLGVLFAWCWVRARTYLTVTYIDSRFIILILQGWQSPGGLRPGRQLAGSRTGSCRVRGACGAWCGDRGAAPRRPAPPRGVESQRPPSYMS